MSHGGARVGGEGAARDGQPRGELGSRKLRGTPVRGATVELEPEDHGGSRAGATGGPRRRGGPRAHPRATGDSANGVARDGWLRGGGRNG